MEIGDSARKHGVGDADIRHAVTNPVAEVEDQRKPYFVMVIGPGLDGQLVEVGIVDPDGDPLVVHAMRLRRNWRRYLPKE